MCDIFCSLAFHCLIEFIESVANDCDAFDKFVRK